LVIRMVVMRLPVLPGAALAAALAVGLALTACGSYPPPGSEPAGQVVPEVQAAAAAATSVHVAGTVEQRTQTTTLDVSIEGDSVAGYLGAYSTRFYVLSLDGDSFVKLNAAFLELEKAPTSLCAQICGKYVQLGVSGAAQITELLSMQTLVSLVFSTKDMVSAAGSGCAFSPATYDGQPVLQCRQGNDTLDVAANGTPYLLYWSGPHGQHLAFSDWNSVVLPPAPPPSQLVLASELG
jgi:hypothetical protein